MRRRAWLSFAEAVILAGAVAMTAAARTWVASPDGESGDGTLALVLSGITDGDTVRVLSGDHQLGSATIDKSLYLFGDKDTFVYGDLVTIRGQTIHLKAITFDLKDRLSLSDAALVTVDQCVYRNARAHLELVRIGHVRVVATRVHDTEALSDREVAGIGIGRCDTAIVENCVFERNLSRAGYPGDERGTGGGALRIGSDTYAIVRGNVFRENEATSGSALFCRSPGLVFENNTVVGNRDLAGAVLIEPNADGTVIRQNVFAENEGFGLWLREGGPTVARVYCNAFWGNNTIGLGDFGERENQQWRAILVHGYESTDDFHSVFDDPMLCDDLAVGEGSLLAEQKFPCEPIGGARGFGCGNPPVRATSWGKLKGLFGK